MNRAGKAGVAALAALLLTWLAGCSDYPDPYTDSCPEVLRLTIGEVSATQVRIRYGTSRLSPTRIRFQPSGRDIQELAFAEQLASDHDVTLTRLIPDTLYGFEIETANRRGPCPGETLVGSFRTLVATSTPDPTGTPVPDPTTPVFPF